MLRDPIAQVRGAVFQVVQIEPAEHRAVRGEKHVEDTGTGLLLGEQSVEALGEPPVERIAPVRDGGREVGPVLLLERQDRGGVVGAQPSQLRHRSKIARSTRLLDGPARHERATVIRLRDSDVIDDTVLRRIQTGGPKPRPAGRGRHGTPSRLR
jgi:hypothetical protein